MQGQRILVTGVTGQVAGPVAAHFARDNEVFGAARFAKPEGREPLEAAGVHTIRLDLETADLDEVPAGLDYVLHFAVAKTNSFDRDLAANAEGVGFLIEKVQGVKGFLHCSSTAVYEPHDHDPRVETDDLGDSHRPFRFMPTYSIAKIAAEVMAKYGARRFGVPVTIARLNVPYGDTYGWPLMHLMMMRNGHPVPVHTNTPSQYVPIHHDDIVASIPLLLGAASSPATIINWGGQEVVSIEDWSTELGRLCGLEPRFQPTDHVIESIVADTTRLQALGFRQSVSWKDGMRRAVERSFPDLLAV
jgi:UDP-glucuronate 4-epimerase